MWNYLKPGNLRLPEFWQLYYQMYMALREPEEPSSDEIERAYAEASIAED